MKIIYCILISILFHLIVGCTGVSLKFNGYSAKSKTEHKTNTLPKIKKATKFFILGEAKDGMIGYIFPSNDPVKGLKLINTSSLTWVCVAFDSKTRHATIINIHPQERMVDPIFLKSTHSLKCNRAIET